MYPELYILVVDNEADMDLNHLSDFYYRVLSIHNHPELPLPKKQPEFKVVLVALANTPLDIFTDVC